MASAKQYLQLTDVKCLLLTQDLVSVTTTTSVAEAMAKLLERKVQSVPVFDATQNRFATFVDTVDIATHAIRINFKTHIIPRGSVRVLVAFLMKVSLASSLDLSDVLERFEKDGKLDVAGAKKAFASATCSEIANISRGNPYFQVLSTDSIKVCIDRMVALVNIHRLPVLNLNGDFLGVLTQSQIVTAIASHIDLFSFANKTVEELRLGYDCILSIHKNKTMKDAFQKISEERSSGIAVVGDDEVIFGNVSASDIKLIGQNGEKIEKVYSKISDVLAETQAKKRPVTVTKATTFKELVKQIVAEKIHRVFVVNESDQLIGVIRLITILDFVQYNV